MFKTILVAVDGSVHADKAVSMAADLAGRYDAKLVIAHSLIRGHIPPELAKLSDEPIPETPPMSLGGASVDYQVPIAAVQSIGKKLLENATATAKTAGVATVESVYQEGEPAQVLLDVAKAHKADLIVMGTRGLGDLKGLLMGSVSHKVQQLFNGCVLTVK